MVSTNEMSPPSLGPPWASASCAFCNNSRMHLPLCDLGVEAGDRAIVPGAVPEFIEKRSDLTLGLSHDELVSGPP